MSMDVRIVHRVRSGEREFQLDVAFKTGHKRVALFGPSGAGKSMTVQAIAGLIRPQDGHIVFNGRMLFDAARRVCLPAQRRKVAYLFQDYALFPHLTVAQNISFGLETGWRNPSRKWLPRAARQWVDAFELDAVVGSYPAELSGGQQQRVALARALAVEPDILLLDEPLAALDAMLRKKMRAELAALQQRLDIPMIVITHDPDDVHALADHVVAIDNGKKAGEFAASELPVQGLFTLK